MNLEDLERILRARLDAVGSTPRDELLRVLNLSDHARTKRSSQLYADSRTETFAEPLIDVEESAYARAVVVGILREEEI